MTWEKKTFKVKNKCNCPGADALAVTLIDIYSVIDCGPGYDSRSAHSLQSQTLVATPL